LDIEEEEEEEVAGRAQGTIFFNCFIITSAMVVTRRSMGGLGDPFNIPGTIVWRDKDPRGADWKEEK